MKLLLASASPRRREILETLRIPCDVAQVDADERERPGEEPDAYLERIVASKQALARPLAQARGSAAFLVADTTVVLGDQILQKPVDREDDARMVRALSGRTHRVMTRFTVETRTGQAWSETVTTRVSLRTLSEDEVARYALVGEGLDKAGGYAIQGLGAFAVTGIEGSYTNVVGLPAQELVSALLALRVIPSFPFVP